MMMNYFATGIEISTGSQALFSLGNFAVTNSLLAGFVSLLILFAVYGYVVWMLNHGRYNRFIGLVQWAFEGMMGQIDSVIPDKKIARKLTPLALTIFY